MRSCMFIVALIAFFGCDSPTAPSRAQIEPTGAGGAQPEIEAGEAAKSPLIGEWQQIDPSKLGAKDQFVDFGETGLWTIQIDERQLKLRQRGGQYSRIFSYRLSPRRMVDRPEKPDGLDSSDFDSAAPRRPQALGEIDLVLEHQVMDDGLSSPMTKWWGMYRLDAGELRLNIVPNRRPSRFVREGIQLLLERKAGL